nr:Ig-like domain-containing protein [Bacilli bacterium]
MKQMKTLFPLAIALLLASCGGGSTPAASSPVSGESSSAKEVTKLTLNAEYKELIPGATFQLEASIEGGPRDVIYWSSDESVVTVNSSGLVTASGVGSAKILAHCNDLEAECEFKVAKEKIVRTYERAGSLKASINSPILGFNEASFHSPVTYSYRGVDEVLCLDDNIGLNLRTNVLEGIEGEEDPETGFISESKEQQAANNLDFVKSIANAQDITLIGGLFAPSLDGQYKLLGHGYKQLKEKYNTAISEGKTVEEVIPALGNEYINGALTKNSRSASVYNDGALRAFTYGESENNSSLTDILSSIKSIDLSDPSNILRIDFPSMLLDLGEELHYFSDSTNEKIVKWAGIIQDIIGILAGGLEITVKNGTYEDLTNYSDITFGLNETGKKNVSAYLVKVIKENLAGSLGSMSSIIDSLFANFTIDKLQLNLGLCNDSNKATHLEKLGFDLSMNLFTANTISFMLDLGHSNFNVAEGDVFEEVKAKDQEFKVYSDAFDDFYSQYGGGIKFFSDDNHPEDIDASLLDTLPADALEAYKALPEGTKAMFGEIDEESLTASYTEATSNFASVAAKLEDFEGTENPTLIKNTLSDISGYTSWKDRLKSTNSVAYEKLLSSLNANILACYENMNSVYGALENLSDEASIDEVQAALEAYQNIDKYTLNEANIDVDSLLGNLDLMLPEVDSKLEEIKAFYRGESYLKTYKEKLERYLDLALDPVSSATSKYRAGKLEKEVVGTYCQRLLYLTDASLGLATFAQGSY